LVNQERPKTIPKIRDKSRRRNLANNNEKKSDQAPNKDKVLSGTANRSKKKEKGNKV
jgi:hypothetical protein